MGVGWGGVVVLLGITVVAFAFRFTSLNLGICCRQLSDGNRWEMSHCGYWECSHSLIQAPELADEETEAQHLAPRHQVHQRVTDWKAKKKNPTKMTNMKWLRAVTSIRYCPLDYCPLSPIYLQEKMAFCRRAVTVDTLLPAKQKWRRDFSPQRTAEPSELSQASGETRKAETHGGALHHIQEATVQRASLIGFLEFWTSVYLLRVHTLLKTWALG